ncbi:MAG: hypothetical protein NUV90_00720 [Candidatus Parcubacteria bacterium]|nr:hypothetical protein [Candidatus Parcubacteria bacterium]
MALPDLTAGTVSPATATVGAAVVISSTITNIGTASTGTRFYNRFEIATNATGSGATSWGTYYANALAAGDSVSASITKTLTSSGTYYVRACADRTSYGAQAITESDENNNCSGWTLFTVSPAACTGTLPANTTAYPAPDNTGLTRDTAYTYSAVNTISIKCQYACSTGYTRSGSSCVPLPDLTAGAVSPIAARRGATTFNATVSNIGTTGTGASFNNFMQVATAPDGGGTVTDISSVSMPMLAAGGTATFSKSYTFTSPGTYSLRVCADKTNRNSSGTITESDEDNNCGAWTTVTPPPIMTLDNVTISNSSITPNATTQYTITDFASYSIGGNAITTELTFINIQGPNAGAYRGYFGWSSDSAFLVFSTGAHTEPIACSGGGFGSVYTDTNFDSGNEYINLLSCSTAVVGNTRTASYVVTFNSNFTSPTVNNTLSGFAGDQSNIISTGNWSPFATFGLAPPPAPPTCTTPWGSTIASGVSVQAFQVSSVISPAACPSSETRTCTNGVLSGSYTNSNCVVLQPSATISANPTRVRSTPPGNTSTITWTISDTTCSITRSPSASGWPKTGLSAPGSNVTDTITGQTTYTITCTGAAPQSITVNILAGFQEF